MQCARDTPWTFQARQVLTETDEDFVNPIQDALNSGRQLLADNPSVAVFADTSISLEHKLAVLPHMSFWVLGFADAMALLRCKPGEDSITHMVRQHADEDADHWRWFVSDLSNLAKAGIGAGSFENLLLQQWGPTTEPVRNCTWQLHSLLRNSQDPVVWLTIIECCEAGFDAFMSCVRPVIQEAGQYGKMHYFGKEHDHAEAGHSMHDHENPFESVVWTQERHTKALAAATTMNPALDRMHTSYANVVLGAAGQPLL